jgi:hypothetical protein
VTRKSGHQKKDPVSPQCTRKTVWNDAEIVVNIEYTKPGTALDDHLCKEQTRALLDLLADYMQKLHKNGDAEP